jgi:hypothetical protein
MRFLNITKVLVRMRAKRAQSALKWCIDRYTAGSVTDSMRGTKWHSWGHFLCHFFRSRARLPNAFNAFSENILRQSAKSSNTFVWMALGVRLVPRLKTSMFFLARRGRKEMVFRA